MRPRSERVRVSPEKSIELRRQIFEAKRYEGLNRKQIASRLGVSRQAVCYHLKFIDTEEWSELAQIKNDLADALTREKFQNHLIELLTRALVWTQLRKMPLPIVRTEGKEFIFDSPYKLLNPTKTIR